MMSAQMTTDPTIIRQHEMESLKREILKQRGFMTPRMVTPVEDRRIDYRESNSVNSRLRRIL
jgi:hypothetical protein